MQSFKRFTVSGKGLKSGFEFFEVSVAASSSLQAAGLAIRRSSISTTSAG